MPKYFYNEWKINDGVTSYLVLVTLGLQLVLSKTNGINDTKHHN